MTSRPRNFRTTYDECPERKLAHDIGLSISGSSNKTIDTGITRPKVGRGDVVVVLDLGRIRNLLVTWAWYMVNES